MSTAIRIDDQDPTPPFEQLRRQIAAVITAGGLGPGERLPTVRQLAADLGVAPGTVMRAYTELEAEGWIVKRRGGGSIVAARPPRRAAPDLDRLAAGFVADARGAGFGDEAIAEAVARTLRAD